MERKNKHWKSENLICISVSITGQQAGQSVWTSIPLPEQEES